MAQPELSGDTGSTDMHRSAKEIGNVQASEGDVWTQYRGAAGLLRTVASDAKYRSGNAFYAPACVVEFIDMGGPNWLVEYHDALGSAAVNSWNDKPASIVYNWRVEAVESLKEVLTSSGTTAGKSLLEKLASAQILNGNISGVQSLADGEDVAPLLRAHSRYAHKLYCPADGIGGFAQPVERSRGGLQEVIRPLLDAAVACAPCKNGAVYLFNGASLRVDADGTAIRYDACGMHLDVAGDSRRVAVRLETLGAAKSVTGRRLLESVSVPGVRLAHNLDHDTSEGNVSVEVYCLPDQAFALLSNLLL